MRVENYIDFSGKLGYSGLFFATGSFGIIDGDVAYEMTEQGKTSSYSFKNEYIELCASFEQSENGVVIRRDTLKNLSDSAIELNDLVSRFCLNGNDYDIYTQYNAWQHESTGEWQRLTTQIRAEACGMRGCDGAAPIMGFHNRQTKKNTVFHLVPSAQWQMTAKKFPRNDKEKVVFEAGFCNIGLRFSVLPGETVYLPEIIFFSAENRTDLDAYKLHLYFNRAFPRKKMPVLYNSWLYCFDKLNIDDLKRQVDAAEELSIEAFMIDAGWFGNGDDWSVSVGDWEENTKSGPCGRLSELSEYVRSKELIFGLWFEPERASANSRAVAEHPNYYIKARNQFLLDFANAEAVSYMTEIIANQIEKYKLGWVKFDFNASIPVDPSGCGFYRYIRGQRGFIEALKKRFPELYITNCASGGYRMDLWQAQFTDSFWLSDNQGPLGGLDIVKGTLKRMPSSCIERWNVQKYAEGFPRYGHDAPVGVMFNCNNGTWDSITALDPTFCESFMLGGPMGFSCDISSFPAEYKNRWSKLITEFKNDRDFYLNASAFILADSEEITAIEYANESFDLCIVKVFTKTVHASELIVYPEVERFAKYLCCGADLYGECIKEDGILISNLKDNSCQTLRLQKNKA